MLKRSEMFGRYQSPNLLPSDSPHCPLAKEPDFELASFQFCIPKQLVSKSQSRLLTVSNMVPLPLSIKREVAGTTGTVFGGLPVPLVLPMPPGGFSEGVTTGA